MHTGEVFIHKWMVARNRLRVELRSLEDYIFHTYYAVGLAGLI